MAEIVELRLERGLNELIELEKTALFTKDEIKKIIQKRQHYEYKLQRISRSKDDYLKYVTYEMSLLQLIRVRRKNTTGGNSKNCRLAQNAEKSIGKRIAAIYRSLVFKYQSDLTLWLSYLDFCKSMDWRGTVSGIYTQILQRHPNQDHLWIAAAKFELEENLTIDSARNLLQRGLRINDKSLQLWKEYFKLEIIYAEKIYLRKCILANGSIKQNFDKGDLIDDELDESTSDAILSGDIAKIVYESGLKATNDPSLGIELLKILEKCECPKLKELEGPLIIRLKELFPSSELVVTHFILNSSRELIQSKSKSEICDIISSKFEEAVEKIATTKMWDSYLTFHLQLVLSSLNIKTRRKQVMKLDDLFEKAWLSNLLSEEMMKEWLLLHRSLLDGSSTQSKHERWKRMDEVIYKLTEKSNQICKPSVWLTCLQSIINTSGFTNDYIHRFFKRAMDKIHRQYNSIFSGSELNGERLPIEEVESIYYLVKLYLEWSIDLLTQKRILSIIETLVRGNTITAGTSNSNILNSRFKLLLIQLANKLCGASCAYEYFIKYADSPPISSEIYDEMLAIAFNSKYERKVIESYISQESLSTNNAEIWLKYIQLLIREKDMGNVVDVYRKAVKMLHPQKVNYFMEKYALFKLEQA